MRKIILLSSVFLMSIGFGFGQSIELTPDGYEGKQTAGNQLQIKTSAIPAINMFRHSGSIASPGATPADFTIGRLWSGGHDGSNFVNGSARLDFRTTSSVWSATNRGSFMRFYTTEDGNAGPTENMRLTDSGKLGIGLTNPGTTFEVASSSAGAGINISKKGGGFGSARLSFWTDRNASNEWRPGYIESNDDGSYAGRLDFYTNGYGSLAKTGQKRGMSLVNGKVLIGGTALSTSNGLSDFALHIASNSVGSETTGTGGLVGLGTVGSHHTTFGHTGLNSWFGANGAVFRLNFFSKGAVIIGSVGEGNLQVEGYTQLGDDYNAPRVKTNVLYGSTGGSSTHNVSHGVADANKILNVSVLIKSATNSEYYPPNGVSSVFHQYSYRIGSSSIKLDDIGTSLQSTNYKIMITYRD